MTVVAVKIDVPAVAEQKGSGGGGVIGSARVTAQAAPTRSGSPAVRWANGGPPPARAAADCPVERCSAGTKGARGQGGARAVQRMSPPAGKGRREEGGQPAPAGVWQHPATANKARRKHIHLSEPRSEVQKDGGGGI